MASNAGHVIRKVDAIEIRDSRNNRTIKGRITTFSDLKGVSGVPGGASKGSGEAAVVPVEIAIENIFKHIAPRLEGKVDVSQTPLSEIDQMLKDVDGTGKFENLGGNTAIAISGAYANLAAAAKGVPLWMYLHEQMGPEYPIGLPVPHFNVVNAGKHADSGLWVQETMVVPVGARTFREALDMGTEIWKALGKRLKAQGHSTGTGDEGGFVNPYKTIEETIAAVLEAIRDASEEAVKAGRRAFEAGREIWLSFDPAASEYHKKDVHDKEPNENDNTYHLGDKRFTSKEMVEFWKILIVDKKHPIIAVEDPMGETDREGWQMFTGELGNYVQVTGDDYFVTNPARIREAIADGIGNTGLIKPNQVGTMTDTLEAMRVLRAAGYKIKISHRSGETGDTTIADLAISGDQMKSGSSHGERMDKYNRVGEIEIDTKLQYLGDKAFPPAVRDRVRKTVGERIATIVEGAATGRRFVSTIEWEEWGDRAKASGDDKLANAYYSKAMENLPNEIQARYRQAALYRKMGAEGAAQELEEEAGRIERGEMDKY